MQRVLPKTKCLFKSIATNQSTTIRNYSTNKPKRKCPLSKCIITLVGGNYNVSHYTALLLKQQGFVDEIRLHADTERISGIAYDLSHIDTKCQIRCYAGPLQLKDAIEGATIVIVSGQIKAKDDTVRCVFETNADYVRNIAIHAAEFNPEAILCISTPPCACMVPMVTEEYKKARVFDPRKVIGIMNVNAVRATSLVGQTLGKDPTDIVVPVVGGDCDKCIVGVFSQVKPHVDIPNPAIYKMQETLEDLQHKALFQRNSKTHCGDTELDVAHATTRFIKMFAKALKCKGEFMESAFVRQTGRIGELSRYLCTPIYVGIDGIESCYLPPLTRYECDKLQAACEHMEKYIEMGESYVTGKICRECRMFPRMSDDCMIVEVAPAAGYEKFAPVFEKSSTGVIEVYYGKENEGESTLGK